MGESVVLGIEPQVTLMTPRTGDGAMIAATGDLLVRSGAEPAPPDGAIDPSVPQERASPAPPPGPSAHVDRPPPRPVSVPVRSPHRKQ